MWSLAQVLTPGCTLSTSPSMLLALGPVFLLASGSPGCSCFSLAVRKSRQLSPQACCAPVLFMVTPYNGYLPGIGKQCPAGPLHPPGFIHSSVKCSHTDFCDIPPISSETLHCLSRRLRLCQPLKSFSDRPSCSLSCISCLQCGRFSLPLYFFFKGPGAVVVCAYNPTPCGG